MLLSFVWFAVVVFIVVVNVALLDSKQSRVNNNNIIIIINDIPQRIPAGFIIIFINYYKCIAGVPSIQTFDSVHFIYITTARTIILSFIIYTNNS